VEQTKRLLNFRISEHRNHIKRNFTQIFVITNHRLDLDYDFDWDNVEILDEEINCKKRFISKMIHIKNQDCDLKLQNNTDLLDSLYLIQQFH